MPSISERRVDFKDNIVLPLAGIFFILQFCFFMYNFNFQGLEFITIIGWLFLIPGFLLVSVSQSVWKTQDTRDDVPSIVAEYILGFTSHPLTDGWLMMSVALAMISQHWIVVLCMGVQVPLIIFNIYDE